jgi:integrase
MRSNSAGQVPSPWATRRVRRKVTGKTKTEVKDKLKVLRRELDAAIQSSASYTMALCINDWLSQGLSGLSPSTVANYHHLADHAVSQLGAIKLRNLTAKQVQVALAELSGSLSTRSLRLVYQIIERAIKHAQAADLVNRNVASLIAAPEGRSGRPSRSLTLDQATAVLEAARASSLHAYVVLSLLAGLRTEELRSLLWTDVDLDEGTVAVYRSVRASGDTKTPKSRRVLKLPVKAVDALLIRGRLVRRIMLFAVMRQRVNVATAHVRVHRHRPPHPQLPQPGRGPATGTSLPHPTEAAPTAAA